MLPDNHEPTEQEIEKLKSFGFYQLGSPYHCWVFQCENFAYDLSAADLNQLDRIKNNKSFIIGSMVINFN
jgi:hypothetical protein